MLANRSCTHLAKVELWHTKWRRQRRSGSHASGHRGDGGRHSGAGYGDVRDGSWGPFGRKAAIALRRTEKVRNTVPTPPMRFFPSMFFRSLASGVNSSMLNGNYCGGATARPRSPSLTLTRPLSPSLALARLPTPHLPLSLTVNETKN